MDGKCQQKEVYGEKRRNKVEEIQQANLARPSQAMINYSPSAVKYFHRNLTGFYAQ